MGLKFCPKFCPHLILDAFAKFLFPLRQTYELFSFRWRSFARTLDLQHFDVVQT